ncbi:putative reductase/deaminase [Nocardia nova SH22a]|uniref:Putative reductase/deaminase n=1 Tax=Nocardia nova SH22a TaxID=1415166 RepID=W5T6R1_9NOCA|nr:RibD family protein [Nocardia nova]AHH14857.1 putative reductase/deaminase [Nocardia nova SH22a]
MTPRPYVVLSVATSIDGYIDDTGPERLLLSNAEDFDRVDRERAAADAILIGAETLRRDNPRLLVGDARRRRDRVAAGRPEFPLRVIVSASGDLDPELRFWHQGGARVVYTTTAGRARIGDRLTGYAEVVALGATVDFTALLDDLGERGIERLMVEGGGRIHTAFLAGDLADEILLAIAPVLVGDSAAPRFLHPARYPGGSRRRMVLDDVTRLGDVAVLRYRTDRHPTEPTPDGSPVTMENPQ